MNDAHRYGIPVLAVTAVGKDMNRDLRYLSLASRIAIELGADIPVEERSPEEITRIKGVQFTIEDIDVTTPAFDITPAELIHGIITEKGVATFPYKKSLEEQRNAN